MDQSQNICLIPGYELFTNYDIDQTGKLRNCKSCRRIDGFRTPKGYLYFTLKQDGLSKKLFQHVAIRHLFNT